MKTILISTFLLLCSPLAHAQWEKLPLYSGHADYLVQNKYKTNEVFAVIKRGGIYGSTDYGDTWEPIVDDKERLGWATDITSFQVAMNGDYLVYADNSLWKSSNKGVNWDRILGKFGSSNGSVRAHLDGTLFFYSNFRDFMLRSRNNAISWDTIKITFPYYYRVENFYLDPDNSNNIFLFGSSGTFQMTNDGGISWKDIQFINQNGSLENMGSYEKANNVIYGIWFRRTISIGGNTNSEYDYYESADSGKIWLKKNLSPIQYFGASNYGSAVYFDSSGMRLKTIITELYRWVESGDSAVLIPNVNIWNFAKPKTSPVGSILIDGLRESPDTGATWKSFKGSRQFPGFSGINFTVLSPDTMFAATHEYYYVGGKPRWVSLLMQSNDGGEHWFDLLKAENIGVLKSGSFPESKYYLISDSHSLVCGKPGQTIPDTLLTTVGNMIQFEISKPYPMDMYVMVNQNGGFSYFFTTDAGATWTRMPVPPYLYDEVVLYPSQIERGKFYAVTHSPNPLDIYGLGIWVVQNYGERWELTFGSPDLDGSLVLITGDDKLFNVRYNQFSSDEGRNWFTDTTGIEGNDWAELVNNGYSCYATSKGLVLASKSFWYLYGRGGWVKLRDASGAPISRTFPAVMDFTGNYLYCGREFNGLYRILVSNITSVQMPEKNAYPDEVVAYPNPFTGYTTISYKLRDTKDVVLRLCNSLGETVLIRPLLEKNGEFTWEGKNSTGIASSSGIYYLIVSRKGVPFKLTPLIILR